jgi:hypothetical protein
MRAALTIGIREDTSVVCRSHDRDSEEHWCAAHVIHRTLLVCSSQDLRSFGLFDGGDSVYCCCALAISFHFS